MLIFIAALIALHGERFLLLCSVLFVGMLNRETPLLLIPSIFLLELQRRRVWLHFTGATLVLAMTYLGIHLLVPVTAGGSWFNFDLIGQNLPFLSPEKATEVEVSNLHVVALLGPLIVLGFYRFPRHPSFLKISAFTIPPYILVHYLVGAVIESRLWLPLLVILIPLALSTLQGLLHERQVETA
jgi:hypothetical protein